MTRPRRIELRIDELVLEGVSASERARVLASLERTLGEQLAAGHHPTHSREAIVGERPASSDPATLGSSIATTITSGGKP